MSGVEHLGEDAELYALGSLDERERERVDAHVRSCARCAARVGRAESAVLRLIETDVPFSPAIRPKRLAPRQGAWAAAVAAALLIGLLPWAATILHDRSVQAGREVAVTAMLAGHFAHAPLIARAAGAPAAKVIFAREGGWIYVIVAPGTQALELAVLRAGRRSVVASVAPSTDTRSAFVPVTGRVDRVELLKAGAPIASARIAYGPGTPPRR